MSKLFLFENSIKRKMEYLLIITISFAFVFKITLSTIPLLILFLINISKDFKVKNIFFSLITLNFFIIFILFFLSFFLLKEEKITTLVKSLCLIFIPLLFYFKKFDQNDFLVFFGSFLVLQIIHIFYVDIIMIKILFIENTTDFLEISKKVEKHFILERPYFSLNSLLAIFSLKYFYDNKTINYKISLLVICFILISLILVAARLSIGVCIILVTLFLLKNTINLNKIIILIVSLIVSFVFFGKHTYERMILKKGEPRIAIWGCANNIIHSKDFNYLYGEFSNEIADKKLIECYNTVEVKSGAYFWISKYNYNYNSHNQFLGFYLGYGLIGLFLFLLIFGIQFLNFYKNKNFYSFIWILIFFSQSIFENLFYRQLGIFVFLWFCCISFFINMENLNNYE